MAASKKQKKILVTSALPYVNNMPHLGNIIGSVLSADVFARHCRLAGKEILFICGSDEHGTATETKADEEGVTPKQLCDKYYKIHSDIYKWFDISYDIFGRTSDPSQTERVQELFSLLDRNGFIAEDEVEQAYCGKEQKFLADRYIEGTCPFCGYEKARGDQCENCGKLLNPQELLNSRCRSCGSIPVTKKTKHLFLDLEKLQPKLEAWVKKRSKEGKWTQNAIATTEGWFAEGLKKRAITRDLKWGVKVPRKGYEKKVFYVWFDAPIGYISITQQLLGEKWKDWWKKPDEVLLYQFMAKDNIPFHTIIFPATLIGSQEKYTMLYHIDSAEYLLYEGGKFSKSGGVGIFGDDARKTGLPAEIFRYYLLINRPENADTTFDWGELQDKVNNELVANFGNLVNRTTTFISNYLGGVVEEKKPDEEDVLLLEEVRKKEQQAVKLMGECHLREAFKEIFNISRIGNQYFQKSEPWKVVKENPEMAKKALFILANIVKDLAILVSPYMPEAAGKIFSQLGITARDYGDLGKLSVKKQKIGRPEILFAKIEDEKILALRKEFSGKKQDPIIKIDFRVANVLSVEDHPEADKLYILQVDLGTEKRQIVAGLKGYMKKEEIKGKNIIVVSNLKPAKLKGIESNGMLLAAEKNNAVRLLLAPKSRPGDRAYVFEPKPEKQITIEDFSKIKFSVKNRKVLYKETPLRTDKEDVGVEIEDGAVVR